MWLALAGVSEHLLYCSELGTVRVAVVCLKSIAERCRSAEIDVAWGLSEICGQEGVKAGVVKLSRQDEPVPE